MFFSTSSYLTSPLKGFPLELSTGVWGQKIELAYVAMDFISQHSAETTETQTNDIIKKIKRENKKLKYKIKAKTH